MLKRLLNLCKSLITAGPKELEDPEHLLKKAQDEMREMQFLHRKRAVEAVTAKNNFQKMCADMRSRIDKINEAEQRGDSEEVQKLRQKRDDYIDSLVQMDAQLARAIETSEQVKDAIQREEEKIRDKTREALELKAQWRNAQSERELERLKGLLELKTPWRSDLDENYNDPLQNDPVLKWVLALIALCLVGLFILRIVG